MKRPSAGATFAAFLALGLLAGGAAGLLDAVVSVAGGRATPGGALFLQSVSLGALLGLAGLLLPAVVLTVLGRPRRAASRLGVALALLVLSPAVLLVGRKLYQAVPWGVGDGVLAVVSALALLALAALAASLAAALSPRAETSAVRFLARAFVPALLMGIPAAARILPALGPPTALAAGEPGATNLLLLTIDTLRPDRLGCTGSPVARTPWIDRLARRSVLFSECMAPSPWTLPSLGTVQTGSYPGEHRVLEELSGLSRSVSTIAEVCKANGRRTAAFVSNPWLSTGSLGRGFDTFDVAERLECLSAVRGTRLATALTKVVLRSRALDAGDKVSARGISWIRRGKGAWFLWLHYFDPHLPNWPHPPYDRLFGPPPVYARYSLTVEDIREGRYEGGAAGRDEIERLYDGEVAISDGAIGAVWRSLEESGALARTAVVFTADHGEELWDHSGYGHGHAMFDEVVRVPWTVRPPGGTAGRVDGDLAALVDLAPTALAAAGVAAPEGAFRGGNRLADDGPVRTATYGEAVLYGREQKFLRAGPWKLVWIPPTPSDSASAEEPPRIRLYDLVRDPAERHDLAPERPALADSLLAELRVWRDAVGSAGAMAARDLPEGLDPATRDQLRALGYVQ